jgi:hypothetical protein
MRRSFHDEVGGTRPQPVLPFTVVALPWDDPYWWDEITAWTASEADLTGPVVELHRRDWSAMVQAPTADGMLYAKATAPSSAHEVPLTEALARWYPALSVELVATDVPRGWLLMRDAGEALRTRLTRDPDLAVVETLYRRYAELQVATTAHVDALIAMGVPDRRREAFRRLARDVAVDHDLVGRLMADLARVPLPDTVVHEEIHDGNVVVRDGACLVIDWADSCVGHPFFGVVVGLRSISDRLGLDPGAEPLERLVQAYLEPWSAVAPVADLRAVFPTAYRLGMLNRALSWGTGLADLTPASRAEHLAYVDAWVEEFTAAEDPLPGT